MIDLKDQKVLIVAPHPDDEVFGCGGFIHRVKQAGGKVYVLFMTVGTTKDFSQKGVSMKDERIKEIEQVAEFLAYDGYRIAFPGDEYHLRLDSIPQKDLINEIERGKDISLQELNPTTILIPPPGDYNQDHRAVSYASLTATRPVPSQYKNLQRHVLTYEYPYGAWTYVESLRSPEVFVELQREDLEAKSRAVALYKSQLKTNKGALSVHGMQTLAYLRGVQCGMEAAEAFCVRRVLV